MKHVGSLDVRKDLRVRGRVEENLRVRKEVSASAFYVRDLGELLPSDAFLPIIKTAKSNSNVVATIEAQTEVALPVPLTGTYHISVDGVLDIQYEIDTGATTSQTDAELEEKIGSGVWAIVDHNTVGNTPQGAGGDDQRFFQARGVLFYDFGGPTNGVTYSYRLSATAVGTDSTLIAGGTSPHRIRARLDRIG